MLKPLPVPVGFRARFLCGLVLLGVVLLAITEALSAFQAIHRIPLLLCWFLVAASAALYLRINGVTFRIPRPSRDPVVVLSLLGTAAILVLTACTAAFSPPNSADAMAYHMPRVVYWAEQASIRFFPTPYLPQIMLQPLTEYFMLHSYVISGGDRLVNFVQWFGSVGTMIGVSSVAEKFGAGPRGQAIAALFCATLPSGILASSGAKNDYFLAMWLVAGVYFAACFVRSLSLQDAVALGAALGLALLTKATAYLFAPWLLAAVFLPHIRRLSRRALLRVGVAFAVALVLNAAHYARNFRLSGSILGYNSAHADGYYRWRNETFGWKQTTSNMLRNVSEQLGGRSEKWNRDVFDWTVREHARLGIDVNDPSTTWREATFAPPRNTNHEADANSKWHLAILGIAAGIVAWRARRSRNLEPVLYALSLLCGFVAFCAYLKWQPYEARLFLPLIVAGSPLAGAALDRNRIPVQLLVCLFLLSIARLPVLQNWTRPLEGRNSVLRVPRDDQYFSDMVQWGDARTYKRAMRLLAPAQCPLIGIDSTNLSLEYPLMALLREEHPGTQFLHTGTQNASVRDRSPVEGIPCAIVCMDCAGDDRRLKLYSSYPMKTVVDKFVLFGTAP